jgi:cytochrome oxidase assembly protein ShyY1
MSHQRIAITAIICVAIAGLTIWQMQRERKMQACLAAGKQWNGPTSSCHPVRLAPILQREQLKRT